jgi:hypothetical protein
MEKYLRVAAASHLQERSNVARKALMGGDQGLGSSGRCNTPSAPLTAERERYLRLVAQGMSNYRACREIGVHATSAILLTLSSC